MESKALTPDEAIKEYEKIINQYSKKYAKIIFYLAGRYYPKTWWDHLARYIVSIGYDPDMEPIVNYKDNLGYTGQCTRKTFRAKYKV